MQAMDMTDADSAPKKTRKVKKQVRKGDLGIVSGTPSLDLALKQDLLQKEAEMIMEDKLVADTEEKKNELETFIYDLRGKLDEQYADLASETEKERLREKLELSEVSLFSIYIYVCVCVCAWPLTSYRTGSTRRAKTRQKACTLPRLRKSGAWPVLLSSDIARRLRQKGSPYRSDWRQRPLPARRRRTPRRRRQKPSGARMPR